MNFNLADLEAFVAVSKHTSFRAAAADLHLSQPALSRRVEKLEKALGVRLFDRTTRSVTPTAVGREFAAKVHELLGQLEQSVQATRGLGERATTEVTIACVPSAVRYFLPEVLRLYHGGNPSTLVRVIDEAASEVLAAVLRSEADFGLNYIGIQEPNLDFLPLWKDPFVVACRPDHPIARKRKVTWAELDQFERMTVAKTSGNRLLLDLALAETPIRPRIMCEVRYVSSLVHLVEAGMGIAAVPRLAMPLDGHPALTSVPLVEPAVTRTLGLIRRRGRTLSPAAQQLYDLLSKSRSGPRAKALRSRTA